MQFVSEHVDNQLLLMCDVAVHTVPSNQNILHHLTGLRLLLPSTSDSHHLLRLLLPVQVSYYNYNPHRHLLSSLLLVIIVAGCDDRLCHRQSRVINDIRSFYVPFVDQYARQVSCHLCSTSLICSFFSFTLLCFEYFLDILVKLSLS